MHIEVVEAEKISAQQEEALERLSAAVYPLEVTSTLPGNSVAWASPQWSLFLWEQNELVTHVGLLVREILQDAVVKRIGGLGGVATHPAKQGQGYASQGLREAAKWLNTDLAVSYALLFCRPYLFPFYKRLSWKPFRGKVYVEQPEGKVEFTVNSAMVLDVREPAPLYGTLDLNGLPW
jgi:aminoglycoside 2'-N-acetyltransferase I